MTSRINKNVYMYVKCMYVLLDHKIVLLYVWLSN